MKYHDITKDDMLNGDGLRTVLWVSGCSHCCRECHNPITWDANEGLPFDGKARKEILEELEKDYISGLTLSGGDPLHAANRGEILSLVKEVKEKFPDKTIWMYTGFTWEAIESMASKEVFEIMEYIDVLVDGEFVAELNNTRLYWRGSSNQRVIDVKATKEAGSVILHCE